jgi:allantoinase
MSGAPAALAGLGAKGAIAPGRDADLVVFAPDEPFVVDPARLHHRHPVTPYAGHELTGVVRDVWLRGQRVVTGGVVGAEPRGRLLRRDVT